MPLNITAQRTATFVRDRTNCTGTSGRGCLSRKMFSFAQSLNIITGLDSFGGTDPLDLFQLLLTEATVEPEPKLSRLFRLLLGSWRFTLC